MRNQRTHILPRLVLAGLALLVMLLLSAPSALASEGCPNEAVRAESNINPTTHEPYDMGLPECRAYEMVSPLEKQQHDAIPSGKRLALAVAPDGSRVGWSSEGDYAGAENYNVSGNGPSNPYIGLRGTAGWSTSSGYAPASLIANPSGVGLARLATEPDFGLYSADMAAEVTCGITAIIGSSGPEFGCALRRESGAWLTTPEFESTSHADLFPPVMLGASRDLSRVVFQLSAGDQLLGSDVASPCNGEHCGGIYELSGIGTPFPQLRLVDLSNEGNKIGPENTTSLGYGGAFGTSAPYDYQAISADGSAIYFTATPAGGVPTLFARLNGTETIAISEPSSSECTAECAEAAPREAIYQGASADGTKVFFTTARPMLNSDTDSTADLYEYNFDSLSGHRVSQISYGGGGDATPGSGAHVGGVLAVSEDGSHIYFVATGVLTTLPNGRGQTASQGGDNVYAYDTNTAETRFVATLTNKDAVLWGADETTSLFHAGNRLAQTTPDGEFLVFDTFSPLIAEGPEAQTDQARNVYRYDYETGQLTRISISHSGFGNDNNTEGYDADIMPSAASEGGAAPDINDINRVISADGRNVVFTTAAQLQSDDVNGAANDSCEVGSGSDIGCDVYLWHECVSTCADGQEGEVNLISSGQDNEEATRVAMLSETGADVYLQTHTRLVGQDTDELGDIYDAKVDGGFPAPTPEPSCAGEACQGRQSSSPALGTPESQSFTGGGNQTAPPFKEALELETKPKSKPLTKAQKSAKAVDLCRRDKSAKRRASCVKKAEKRYGKVKARHKG